MRPLTFSAVTLSALALAGCSTSFAPTSSTGTPATHSAATITGSIFGGRQAIVGAKVFLLENGITGNGGPGLVPSPYNQSLSLLAGPGTATDLTPGPTYNMNYVLTGATGGFSISGDYTCDAGRQVYIFALGGKPDGETENTGASNMVALGACPSTGVFPTTLHVYMNEVSTVAMAYAVAGYAADATHISSSGTALATTGLNNAFANAAQLYDISDATNGTGNASARTLTPNGQGTVPTATLNSLANTLAACVNSATGSPQCTTLFNNSLSFGAGGGITPADTASAAINIAHNPATSVATLLQLPAATGYPFSPNLGTTTPTDLTVSIAFPPIPSVTTYPSGQPPVIDADGNVWIVNDPQDSTTQTGNILRTSPLGDTVTCPSTACPTTFTYPNTIAISAANVPWVSNTDNNGGTLTLSPTQTPPTIIATDSTDPNYLAFDAHGHAWVNYGYGPNMSVYTSTGTPATAPFALTKILAWRNPQADHVGNIDAIGFGPALGISQASLTNGTLVENSYPFPTDYTYSTPFTVDATDNFWLYSQRNSDSVIVLQQFSNTGTLLQTLPSPYTDNNSSPPQSLTFDGAGNLWAANIFFVTEQTPSGTVLSPANAGFGGGNGTGSIPYCLLLALDGSGNVWTEASDSLGNAFLVETIGAATPVITPISPNNPADPTTTGLATRP